MSDQQRIEELEKSLADLEAAIAWDIRHIGVDEFFLLTGSRSPAVSIATAVENVRNRLKAGQTKLKAPPAP